MTDDLLDAIFAPLPADEEWKPLDSTLRNHHRRTTRGTRVTLITLNRPQALNALNSQVLEDLIAGLRRLSRPTAASAARC